MTGRDKVPAWPESGDSVEAGRVKAAVLQRLLPDAEVGSPKIGRFIVLRRVGRGGMGVVYAVYDEQLDRRVALKVVNDDGRPELRTRLQREARAMAKLTHPNVVPVFEVGEHEGEAYIVMEYVKGQTLRQWVAGVKRTPDEILDKYIQAGQGLAAAHEHGLIHRDFKPDNAMVGESGRVRVLDFGLARKHTDTEDITLPDTALPTPRSSDFDTPLTATGSMVGTPVYMAPEQFLGETVDHRTDQFSFCVALWEALCGERPFAGKTRSELVANVTAGKPRDRGKLPARLRGALLRGLSVDSNDRFASMPVLLAALRPATRRSWRWVAGLGLVALGAGIWAWSVDRAQRCTGAQRQLAGVWDGTRRVEVEEAMLDAHVPFAPQAWENTARYLDTYVDQWRDMFTEACAATTIRGEQSIEVMDLRMACLHRAKIDLQAIVGVLATADAGVVTRANEVVASLRPVDRCADVEALQSDVDPPPPEEADAVEKARAKLAEAWAETLAGRYRTARDKIEAAKEILTGVEYGPMQAELLNDEGHVHSGLGEYDAAAAKFERALESAARWDQRDHMTEASSALLYVLGHMLSRPNEALRYAPLARGLARDPFDEANVSLHVGGILATQGDLPAAEAEFRQALVLYARAQSPRVAHNVAAAHTNLGRALLLQDNDEEAAAELRLAVMLMEKAVGPEHPRLATALENLAVALDAAGQSAEAEAGFRRALAIREKALGPDHPHVTTSQLNLAVTLLDGGRVKEALELAESAWARRQRDGTPAERANTGFLLARAIWASGGNPVRRQRARDLAEQALAEYRTAGIGYEDRLVEVEAWLTEHDEL